MATQRGGLNESHFNCGDVQMVKRLVVGFLSGVNGMLLVLSRGGCSWFGLLCVCGSLLVACGPVCGPVVGFVWTPAAVDSFF